MSTPEPAHFRQVLGQYPTGVAVVTALDDGGQPLGMTVGSFTSVSLDPPLVAFLPDQGSSSWGALRASGERFCVNVLGAHQEDVCRAIAMRKTDKFEGIPWHLSPQGNPVIDGAVAYIDCSTEQIHDAGDHHIVVGRVHHLDLVGAEEPLLFFRGGYGSFAPLSLASGEADLYEQLRAVDLARPQMESLARRFDSEVTAISLVRDELVLVASAGRTKLAVAPTRVGQRLPFMPPLGSCFAAWGGAARRERWLARLDASHGWARAQLVEVPALVRRRGYAIALGHKPGEELENLTVKFHESGDVSRESLEAAIADSVAGYNPHAFEDTVELRFLTAPVFGPDREVAFTLTLWGPAGPAPRELVRAHVDALLAATADATQAVGGTMPAAAASAMQTA
jgi:flavin reductase (DIM6/NTAB) family NADH-FMN oxidoreductase RutF/DNA-binding IclR family transcriptional regulator